MRYLPLIAVSALALAGLVLWLLGAHVVGLVCMLIGLPLAALGVRDLFQARHGLLRIYPLVGHFRYLAESIRPQVQQYFVEEDNDGQPFNRNERNVVYRRAKNVEDDEPFGTELDVYGEEYEWLNHSIAALPGDVALPRLHIGSDQCTQPYQASRFNISAMSFGSLGARAIEALNRGAAAGQFAHDTGEGAISPSHRHGGDLIWEVGTGYFGCRNKQGRFDPSAFSDQANDPQVKMIEVKLSQGAKPGHGGVLPGAKVTPEIAKTRGVPVGKDCISPPAHSAFTTPTELVEFLAKLRELSGGKPVGIKLCIGHPREFMAVCKAMLETDVRPDFIVVDGAEGGTGAAPPEFPAHVGTPLRDGLLFARNVLVGAGLKEEIALGASGKVVTGFRLASNLALGADWCNSARGFMFALGCLQSQRCHTGHCPTGITTHDPLRQRGLIVAEKAGRVTQFHRHTIESCAALVGATGVSEPAQLTPEHLLRRKNTHKAERWSRIYPWLNPGELLSDGDVHQHYRDDWGKASSSRFAAT